MDQATHIHTPWERIDPYLVYLFREWEDHDRLNFVVEWPIREDRLHQLGQWDAQGLLTPEQQARYEELLQLMACHRPLFDRLLDRDE